MKRTIACYRSAGGIFYWKTWEVYIFLATRTLSVVTLQLSWLPYKLTSCDMSVKIELQFIEWITTASRWKQFLNNCDHIKYCRTRQLFFFLSNENPIRRNDSQLISSNELISSTVRQLAGGQTMLINALFHSTWRSIRPPITSTASHREIIASAYDVRPSPLNYALCALRVWLVGNTDCHAHQSTNACAFVWAVTVCATVVSRVGGDRNRVADSRIFVSQLQRLTDHSRWTHFRISQTFAVCTAAVWSRTALQRGRTLQNEGACKFLHVCIGEAIASQ